MCLHSAASPIGCIDWLPLRIVVPARHINGFVVTWPQETFIKMIDDIPPFKQMLERDTRIKFNTGTKLNVSTGMQCADDISRIFHRLPLEIDVVIVTT